MPSQQGGDIYSTRKIKAHWTPEFHEIFVSLCVDQVFAGNRPGTCLNKEGWKNVMAEFKKRTGMEYVKKQFKNHWDNTKDQWKVWNKLTKNVTRSELDPTTGTIIQNDEGWTNYLKANPDAAQFRYKGIPLADSLDILFLGITTNGSKALARLSTPEDVEPTRTIPYPTTEGINEDVPKTQMNNQESPYVSEPENDVEPPSQRRRLSSNLTSACHIPREESGVARMDRQIYHLVDAVEKEAAKYTIKECIDLLNKMKEIEEGGSLYMFALDVFLKKEHREIFIDLGKPSLRIGWLRRQQEIASRIGWLHLQGSLCSPMANS